MGAAWSVWIAGLGMLALAPAPVAAQDNREFRDWAAECDAGLSCKAYTHHVGDDPAAYLFHLRRGAGEAAWSLVLEVNAGHPEEPYDIYADLTGGATQFSAKVEAAAHDRPNDLYLLGDNANALMAGLGPASQLNFEFIDDDGDLHEPRFSLSGLSASLLWIDEKQGRVGSPRVAGNPPVGAVRDVLAYASDDMPEELLTEHGAADDCEAFEDLPAGANHSEIRLSDAVTLYLVPCHSGAYNDARAAYTASNGYVERLRFADYSTYSSWTVSDVIVNPEWDEATQRLTMFNRGRGLGDCGSIGEWSNRDGFLRLEKFFHKSECDAEGEPGQFPLVYEAPALEE